MSKKYCRLCRRKEERSRCSYGGKMWDRYSVDDASEKETMDAAKETGIISDGDVGESHVSNFSKVVIERNKAGDNSLCDRFSKSYSYNNTSDGIGVNDEYTGNGNAENSEQRIEGFNYSNWRDDFKATEYEFTDLIKSDPLKVEEEVVEKVSEAVRIPAVTGNIIDTYINWRGRYLSLKLFFPETKMPRKADIQVQIEKIYPSARVLSFRVSDYKPGEQFLRVEEVEIKN